MVGTSDCRKRYPIFPNGASVFVSGIGCASRFPYYVATYGFHTIHGRAPAVATGIKRARPDLIVFTYQGDGDLASIGMSEIVHCANRGEKVTVVFVNNAIYGMTGGQMAPTTMPDQRTTTSPLGRNVGEVGMPMKVAELLTALQTPAYITRQTVTRPKYINKAKKAIRQAFTYQLENRCFSLVEVVSTCPTNWGMTPMEAIEWAENTLLDYYKPGDYKLPA